MKEVVVAVLLACAMFVLVVGMWWIERRLNWSLPGGYASEVEPLKQRVSALEERVKRLEEQVR